VRITVRVRPGASRARVGGRYGTGSDAALVVSVTARAVDGAATAAALTAVAKAFAVAPYRVALVSGARSRTKILDVDLDQGSGEARLAALLDT
jgi:hypothetical protein